MLQPFQSYTSKLLEVAYIHLTYYFVGKYIKEFKPEYKAFKNIVLINISCINSSYYGICVADKGVYKHILTDYSSFLD